METGDSEFLYRVGFSISRDVSAVGISDFWGKGNALDLPRGLMSNHHPLGPVKVKPKLHAQTIPVAAVSVPLFQRLGFFSLLLYVFQDLMLKSTG